MIVICCIWLSTSGDLSFLISMRDYLFRLFCLKSTSRSLCCLAYALSMASILWALRVEYLWYSDWLKLLAGDWQPRILSYDLICVLIWGDSSTAASHKEWIIFLPSSISCFLHALMIPILTSTKYVVRATETTECFMHAKNEIATMVTTKCVLYICQSGICGDTSRYFMHTKSRYRGTIEGTCKVFVHAAIKSV